MTLYQTAETNQQTLIEFEHDPLYCGLDDADGFPLCDGCRSTPPTPQPTINKLVVELLTNHNRQLEALRSEIGRLENRIDDERRAAFAANHGEAKADRLDILTTKVAELETWVVAEIDDLADAVVKLRRRKR